jgi:hypothetical protein
MITTCGKCRDKAMPATAEMLGYPLCGHHWRTVYAELSRLGANIPRLVVQRLDAPMLSLLRPCKPPRPASYSTSFVQRRKAA